MINTFLLYRRSRLKEIDYICCNTLERKIMIFLAQGVPRREIARRCGVRPDSVTRCIRRLRRKVEDLWRQKQPIAPTNKQLYQQVKISEIPFSHLTTLDDDEELEYEPSDQNQATEATYRQLDVDTAIENSDTYQMLSEKRQRELAKLLARGLTREECARQMGIGVQAVHQLVGRMRKRLSECKKNTR